MKTLKNLTALLAALALMLSVNLVASNINFTFEEEAYVDDIPFSTELIVTEILKPEFDFEDEAYIDDIPFDTQCVAMNCIYQKAVAVPFDLDDETYVDDIPFSTPEVAGQANYEAAVEKVFKMDDEAYVDDIPFKTEVVASALKSKQEELYVSGM